MPPTDRDNARLVEVRTYKLKPGHSERFVAAMADALPMVRASGMDVVAFVRSEHEHESYCLIRAYADREQLIAQQDAFYGSDAWRQGPRQALIDCLQDYLNTLLWLSPQSIEDLRSRNRLEND
ncbi:antibiotic biosynthesis monooxygenase [Lysobacter enzymogenes]|uniref:Integron gene cassette protein n=1 Tax=Lysobacter enzymogenes TaxID=69 RepID=A0AAU9AFV5_LYSEN|nr:antibiotic biosynthesis monooxygenase [Lysobacter enzymogenes]BAV98107.1 integron gene cassette protein [Lysobacter enzymogenes]